MARPGITYQDVALAAQTLQTEQRALTIENLRHVLGTGSHSTIAMHFRQWRTQQNDRPTLLSHELPPTLLATVKTLWTQLSHESDERIQTAQQEAEQHITDIRRQYEALHSQFEQQKKLIFELNLEKKSLQAQKLATEQALINVQQDLVQLTTKIEGLHAQVLEKETRITELHHINHQTQTNLEHYRESHRQQRTADQERVAQERKQVQLMVAELKKTNDSCIKEKTGLIKEIENQKLQCHHLRFEKSEQDKIVQTLQKNQHLAEQNYKAMQEKLNGISQDYKATKKYCIDQEKQLISQQKDNFYLKAQITQLSENFSDLKKNHHALLSEKNLLLQEKRKLESKLLRHVKAEIK